MTTSIETFTVDEPFTAYATTDISGVVATQLSKIDYNFALEMGEPLGHSDGATMPTFFDSPELSLRPDHANQWPCRLFKLMVPTGAIAMRAGRGRLITDHAEVVSEEDSSLVLGPQREQLYDMAAKLLDITTEQQDEMTRRIPDYRLFRGLARALYTTAEGRGRRNSGAVMNLMWSNSDVWARAPISAAAMVVAQRDLLTPIERDIYGHALHRPWQQVMGD